MASPADEHVPRVPVVDIATRRDGEPYSRRPGLQYHVVGRGSRFGVAATVVSTVVMFSRAELPYAAR